MATQVDLAKIRELRRARRLRQIDMARALGYQTVQGYFYLEHGRRRMTADQLITIACVLKVDVRELAAVEVQ